MDKKARGIQFSRSTFGIPAKGSEYSVQYILIYRIRRMAVLTRNDLSFVGFASA
jgi:hypothetical protein